MQPLALPPATACAPARNRTRLQPRTRSRCVAEATFTSLGLQSPAPRAALPAEPAAADKRDASAQLTSCVLPSRATDVLNPAMRSFFAKGSEAAAAANQQGATPAGGASASASSADRLGP